MLQLDDVIATFGLQGEELPEAYWNLLKESTQIKTVEEEQNERFFTSTVIPLPHRGFFAQNVAHTFKACLASCELTKNEASLLLIQAGNSLLSTHYNKDNKTFYLHEKYMRFNDCACEVGLSNEANLADVLFLTVKNLFEEALTRRLAVDSKVLTPTEKNRERGLIEQKLMAYSNLLSSIDASCTASNSGEIEVHWAKSSTSKYRGSVALQLHLHSTCSHLKNYRINEECESL